MPLQTSIARDGELLPLRWGDFHRASMGLAAMFDAETGPCPHPGSVYQTDVVRFECYPDAAFPVTRMVTFLLNDYGALSKTPLNYGVYTLTRKHKFMNLETSEVLTLLPGDELRAVRH